MIRTCTATLIGVGPYSSSRAHQAEKLPKETAEDYEARTWREKAHVEDGMIVIPPMAFKMALDRAAKMRGEQIPGRGKATYTKFFESGVLVLRSVPIAPVSAMGCEKVHANADGVRGSGKRVWRLFPRVDQWRGEVEFSLIADEITPDVFERTLKEAGLVVGVGRFRPERGGFFGRFNVEATRWN